VPNAALRFQPSLNHAGQSSAPTKSFVQSLIPMPPRQPIATDDEAAPLSSPAEGAGTLWFLQEGQPVRQVVTLGLSDGRVTEVSGEQLREGQAIILRLQTKSQP
jgi:HlyD family secretion protein